MAGPGAAELRRLAASVEALTALARICAIALSSNSWLRPSEASRYRSPGCVACESDLSASTVTADPMARVMILRIGEAVACTRLSTPARTCSATSEWSCVSWCSSPERKEIAAAVADVRQPERGAGLRIL